MLKTKETLTRYNHWILEEIQNSLNVIEIYTWATTAHSKHKICTNNVKYDTYILGSNFYINPSTTYSHSTHAKQNIFIFNTFQAKHIHIPSKTYSDSTYSKQNIFTLNIFQADQSYHITNIILVLYPQACPGTHKANLKRKENVS